MKHEELLEKLWEKRNSLCDHLDIHFALSTIVELHKPFDADVPRCSRCMDATTENGKYEMMPSPYPCETIRTIEKELV